MYKRLCKKNWAQTLRSGFSIGGVDSTPPPRWSHNKNMPWGIGLKTEIVNKTLECNFLGGHPILQSPTNSTKLRLATINSQLESFASFKF